MLSLAKVNIYLAAIISVFCFKLKRKYIWYNGTIVADCILLKTKYKSKIYLWKTIYYLITFVAVFLFPQEKTVCSNWNKSIFKIFYIQKNVFYSCAKNKLYFGLLCSFACAWRHTNTNYSMNLLKQLLLMSS